ncbi:hypothetical protein G6F24_013950 [Rhizopus arrhizus]|nr:hypothetical protein G6F24_013950 [Rhizopus arrhizus]
MARYTGPMLSPIPTLQVALPVPLPRLFDYLSPEGDAPAVVVGCRVKVPFGNRELVGVVVGHGQADDGQGLRQALAWCDPQALLQGELWQSLQWLARYTHAPLGEVLSTALPGPLRHGEALPETHHWGWQLTHEGRAQREKLRAGSRPRQLAELLAEAVVDEDVLGERMDDWRTAARSLAKRELAERVALSVAPQHAQPLPGPTLNPDQAEAVAAINAAGVLKVLIAVHNAARAAERNCGDTMEASTLRPRPRNHACPALAALVLSVDDLGEMGEI